jgi:F420-dependent methylenetetrahydromethanopterin dehydrogenase
MAKVVEMDFPSEKHVEQPYNLETIDEVIQKLFNEEEVDLDHVIEAKRIMEIKSEASPFAHLAAIYAIGSNEEEKTSPRIDCKVNNIDCKALCDIGAQVSCLLRFLMKFMIIPLT